MTVERDPDGTVRFVCRRPGDPTAELNQWIAGEADRQGRCRLCIQPVHGGCDRPPLSEAQAVAVLKGMVQG